MAEAAQAEAAMVAVTVAGITATGDGQQDGIPRRRHPSRDALIGPRSIVAQRDGVRQERGARALRSSD